MNRSDCDRWLATIDDVAEGRAAPGADAGLTAHLDACPSCADEMRLALGWRAMAAHLDVRGREAADRPFSLDEEALLDAVRARPPAAGPAEQPALVPRVWAPALVIALATCAASFVALVGTRQDSAGITLTLLRSACDALLGFAAGATFLTPGLVGAVAVGALILDALLFLPALSRRSDAAR